MGFLPELDSELERAFDTQFIRLGQDMPRPIPHFKFAEPRQFAFDRAWPEHKVAVELEGIFRGAISIRCHNCGEIVHAKKKDGTLGEPIRLSGYHQRYGRFKTDKEKYNLAQDRGWIVLRFLNDDVYGDPFTMIEEIRTHLDSRRHLIPQIQQLSKREDEILHLIAAGYGGPEIAAMIGVSEPTVRSHTQNIRQKLIAPNRASAVARAVAWGLLDIGRVPWRDETAMILEGFDDDE
jgi:DNA-binding CsgD family transcriptional regulator